MRETEIPRGTEPMEIGARLEGGDTPVQAPPLPSLFLETRGRVARLAPPAPGLVLLQFLPSLFSEGRRSFPLCQLWNEERI